MEQLLSTKLHIPSIRPELVPRPRLIEQLNDGLHRKLTLISAPAGFGKTTLVAEWVGGLRLRTESISNNLRPANFNSRPQFAWLSLDENDNDPIRFLIYSIAALRTIDPDLARGALSSLKSPQPPPTDAILTALINEIAAFPQQMVFILDDYHLIESRAILDLVNFLLEHIPSQMHLVIATREDPHLPLARLRARGHLNELRAADLRFTYFEAAEFLNQMMGLELAEADITALETRTEGWIAGLQLAAISMQGSQDATRLIQSFTGSHRYVLDYLIEEVLEQQSERVQTFLLRTAILNRLTGSLCDALTGYEDGQATLEMLDRTNLFVVALDDERCWYRYHHLFSELLRQRLRITDSNLEKDLHARAAIWYESHGNLSEAIHHALAMDDIKTAVRLIEKGAREALDRSELGFILKWVDRLPNPALKNSPWLFIYHSWAALLTGQIELVSPRLKNTEWLLNATSDDEAEKKRMLGNIAGLNAISALWQRDLTNSVEFARQAVANLPENNWIRGYCAIIMGSSLWGNGDLKAAKKAHAESYAVGKASGNKMLEVSGGCNLAYSLELEGRIQQAAGLYQGLFQLAEQDGKVLPVAGYIYVDLARVIYELNNLDLACQYLMKGIELCQQLADGRAEKIGHCLLARVKLAQGDHLEVVNSIRNAASADPSPGTPFDLRGGEYTQVRLWLEEKKFDDLKAWINASGLNLDDISFFKTKLNYTMHARVLIALAREQPDGTYLKAALELLEKLLEMAESNTWGRKVIEILALQALALQEQGNMKQAVTTLERALIRAEPEGYVRIFIDEGPPMACLLYEALGRGIAPDYIHQLLMAFPAPEPEQATAIQTQAPDFELIEPLSERETEILQFIAHGLTNQEIAISLYLSINTVKVHTRNIYGKLGVNNRTQAVATGRVLGILSTT